jgi:hypothetical protein
LVAAILRVFEPQISRNDIFVTMADERTSENKSIWLLSLYVHHQVFQSIIGEFVVNSEWAASHHVLKGFRALVLLEHLNILSVDLGRERWYDCWLPDPVHVELLGIHEPLRHNYLAFE